MGRRKESKESEKAREIKEAVRKDRKAETNRHKEDTRTEGKDSQLFSNPRWKGKKIRYRTHLMDLRDTTAPLRTYHLVDYMGVRISYRNNIPTCGRCHLAPEYCVGGGLELGRPKVSLDGHIQWLTSQHLRQDALRDNPQTISKLLPQEMQP